MTRCPEPTPLQPLARMFDRVSGGYDLTNRLLTLGLDQHWRRQAVKEALAKGPQKILDACCGTADMAVLLARKAPEGVSIWAADFSEAMLEKARAKARRHGVEKRIEFLRADVSAAPFPDGFFDAITIGFGFRNMTWRNPRRDANLAGLRRMLAEGGRLVVVETSQPPSKIWRAFFHAYQKTVVARLGGMFTRDRPAYRYLATSAINFFTAPEVCDMLREAGFSSASHRYLTGGIVAVVVATA